MADEKKITRYKRNHGEWCFYEYKPKKWVARKQFGRKENGKPNIKALYGNSASEVKKKSKDYDFMLRSNGNVDSTKMVFDKYYKNWMTTYKLHQLKPTSYDALEECLECRIRPYPILAKAQMFNVTTLLLQKYINELVSSQKYSYGTIKRTKVCINNCLKKAVQLKDLPYNPMDGVELPSEDVLSVKTKAIEFLDDDDMEKIYLEAGRVTEPKGGYSTAKYYKAHSTRIYRYGYHVVFLMYTGLRIGEALGLKWGDINFAKKEMLIRDNMTTSFDRDKDGARITNTKSKKLGSTKTKKGTRTVSLSKRALIALCEIKKLNRDHVASTNFVFLTSKFTPVSDRNIRRTFNAMQERSKTRIQNSGLHCLRHTFASALLRHGVDVKIVSELLGHAKVSTTYDIYAHFIPSQKINAVSVLDKDDE